MDDSESLFLKIVSGEIPSTKVYETENVLAFLDINPINKGHTLVIPKKHVRDIYELSDDLAAEYMQTIVKVANAVKKVTGAKGINIYSNNGVEAGQIVFHLHFHIIPRFEKDEIPRTVRSITYESKEEEQEIANKIAKEIQ